MWQRGEFRFGGSWVSIRCNGLSGIGGIRRGGIRGISGIGGRVGICIVCGRVMRIRWREKFRGHIRIRRIVCWRIRMIGKLTRVRWRIRMRIGIDAVGMGIRMRMRSVIDGERWWIGILMKGWIVGGNGFRIRSSFRGVV